MTWLIVSQAVLAGCLLVAVGWFSQRENWLSGLPMWPDAIPWLLSGAVFAGLACAFAATRAKWAFGALVSALMSASAAIVVSGVDISRYWATAAEFAAQVAQMVPADKPLLFHGIDETTLVYYGRFRGPRMSLRDWIAANGTRDLPFLVCKRKCRLEGYDLEGRVLLQQRKLGQSRYLILFEPSRVRLRTPPSSRANQGDPAASPP